jgi:hypothetical protein
MTDHLLTSTHGAGRVRPDRTTRSGSVEVTGLSGRDRRMTEQSGERRVTAQVGAELISLMVPDVDLELVQLMLSRAARSAAGSRADHEGHRAEGSKPRATPLQEYAELLALIRDAGIDPARLCAILGLHPETLPTDNDNPYPPIQ